MPTRPTTPPAIARAAIESCADPASVLELFRLLRYPVEAAPIPVPIDSDALPESLRDGIRARYPIAQVGGEHPGEPLVTVTLFVLMAYSLYGAARWDSMKASGSHIETTSSDELITRSQLFVKGAIVRA